VACRVGIGEPLALGLRDGDRQLDWLAITVLRIGLVGSVLSEQLAEVRLDREAGGD
jgi:hypothetical protein